MEKAACRPQRCGLCRVQVRAHHVAAFKFSHAAQSRDSRARFHPRLLEPTQLSQLLPLRAKRLFFAVTMAVTC